MKKIHFHFEDDAFSFQSAVMNRIQQLLRENREVCRKENDEAPYIFVKGGGVENVIYLWEEGDDILMDENGTCFWEEHEDALIDVSHIYLWEEENDILLKVLHMLGVEPTREDLLLSAHNVGGIPAMLELGATHLEVAEITYMVREAVEGGFFHEKELEAEVALFQMPPQFIGETRIVKTRYASAVQSIRDRLYQNGQSNNIFIYCEDDEGDCVFFGPEKTCYALMGRLGGDCDHDNGETFSWKGEWCASSAEEILLDLQKKAVPARVLPLKTGLFSRISQKLRRAA